MDDTQASGLQPMLPLLTPYASGPRPKSANAPTSTAPGQSLSEEKRIGKKISEERDKKIMNQKRPRVV
ncbi:hypothetical protein B0H10DRAFT_2077847 [Mycena sp. CBHHK59/15]|nr:hypothetical protein B0H10DRAFT_2077847 [Mycena sp. CBHHK59/15]